MFEHIHFSKNYSSLDITSGYILEKADQGEIRLEHPMESYSTADFHIHGVVRSIFPHPVTEENMANFLYLQDFCYMCTDESYYSHQISYESYQLLYTYQGKAEMIYQGKRYLLTPGTLLIADCTSPRSVRTIGNLWESSDLHFYGGRSKLLYNSYFSQKSPLFTVTDFSRFQSGLEDILRAHTTVSLYRDWNVSSAMENLLLMILASAPEQSDEIPERIQYLITYMENNYSQPLSIDMLSEFANLSKYHLSREFKRFTGLSPHSYITQLRLNQAKSLLLHSSLPAYKVAQIVGFGDESNFIKLFKRYTNMTPGEFRSSMFTH